jgi:hypothetical protein
MWKSAKVGKEEVALGSVASQVHGEVSKEENNSTASSAFLEVGREKGGIASACAMAKERCTAASSPPTLFLRAHIIGRSAKNAKKLQGGWRNLQK